MTETVVRRALKKQLVNDQVHRFSLLSAQEKEFLVNFVGDLDGGAGLFGWRRLQRGGRKRRWVQQIR